MARKGGPWTKYRRARERLADLEGLRTKLEGSRPRTPGKKGARTRGLNKLARRIGAAKGRLTKARRAIARSAAQRIEAKSVAQHKRSEAAKNGWSRRRAATKVAPPTKPTHRMRFLEERDGEVKLILVYPPDKADRSLTGLYWYAVGVYRDTGATQLFWMFEKSSIYDAVRDRRLPFVTNLALLREAIAAGLTDFDDLYAESAWSSVA